MKTCLIVIDVQESFRHRPYSTESGTAAYLQFQNALIAGCEERGIPVMFHTGTSIFAGARNRFADPIYVDDVGVDFPRLKIILAHGGRPLWMDTCIFLVRRFPNVYMDVSSIPPSKVLEYFPRLEELSDKVLFGTDWPAPMVPGMRENYEAFRKLPLSDQARARICKGNATKIFGT